MMRSCIAVLLDYDHPQTGQAAALKALSAELRTVEYMSLSRTQNAAVANKRLLDLCASWKPDWIWMQLQDTEIITADTLMEIRRTSPKTVLVHWTGDARPSVSSYLASICRACHLTLTSCAGQIPLFATVGAERVEYLQIGLDWNEDVLHLPDWTPPFRVPDVVFCGNHYGNRFPGTTDREALIRALRASGIDAGVVGRSGWPSDIPVAGECAVKQQGHVYRAAKVALSCNHFGNIEQYYSDRQLIAMASGTAVVCQYIPGLEREFVNGKHCLWYHTTAEAVEHVKGLLADEPRRRTMGREGRAEVVKNHSWFKRMLDVYAMVEGIHAA